MPPTSEPPPDTEHRGYAAAVSGEHLLLAHKRWNAAALEYEKEAGGLVTRHADFQSPNEHYNAIVQRLALPWTPFNWAELRRHYTDGRFIESSDDEVLRFMQRTIYYDNWRDLGPAVPWGFVFDFRRHLKGLDIATMNLQGPHGIAETLQACLKERTSWSQQDLALDTAISQLPLRLRGEIDASIIKSNYQLFLIAITNAFPIPEDQFEYHLRRYHALKVACAHMDVLLEHFIEEEAFAATVARSLRPYAYVMYKVIMVFLYHIRIFDPSNYLQHRTLFGWTTGILSKWIKACHRLGAGLRALRDGHPFQPGSLDYLRRQQCYDDVVDLAEDYGVSEDHRVEYIFNELISHRKYYSLPRGLPTRMKKSFEDLRRASYAAEILRVLPPSADPVFLGLDDEPGEKDEVAQLYDRMRGFVDVREYACCEEHGAVGDM